MIKFLKIFLVNSLLILGGIVIMELIFGAWILPKNNMNFLHILKSRTIYHDISTLYESESKIIKYTRDKFGLRSSFPNSTEKIEN